MLTKDQILKHLKDDPLWEPDEDASEADWDLYEETYEEFEAEESGQSKVKVEDDDEDDDDLSELEDDDDDFLYDDEE